MAFVPGYDVIWRHVKSFCRKYKDTIVVIAFSSVIILGLGAFLTILGIAIAGRSQINYLVRIDEIRTDICGPQEGDVTTRQIVSCTDVETNEEYQFISHPAYVGPEDVHQTLLLTTRKYPKYELRRVVRSEEIVTAYTWNKEE